MAITDIPAETLAEVQPPESEAFLYAETGEKERIREEAKLARLAQDARLAEQRFYQQGVQDWVGGNRDTSAAQYYRDYWAPR